jgi:hypothetical protein
MKQPYEKPAITYSEEIVNRATACAKISNADCPGGPLTS